MSLRIAMAAFLVCSLAACGGGASSRSALPGVPGAPLGSAGNATAQFVIKVPPKTGSSTSRGPAYVSPSTQSISIQVDSGTPTLANLTPGSPNCNVPAPLSPLSCTLSIPSLAAGAHTFTIKTFDGLAGAGNLLSVNSAPFTVVANQANLVNITLAGVPASLLVEPGSGDAQIVGSGTAGLQFTGETSHTIVVLPEDADGNLILGPGAPTLAATLTGVGAGSGLSVAPASGGNPNAFTISSTGFGGATLALVATPASASAGSAVTANVALDATVDSTIIAGGGTFGYADGTGGAAQFDGPFGIAVDTANNDLYVADDYACSIRQVTTAGVVTTPYGSPPASGVNCGGTNGTGNAALFGSPIAVAYDSVNGDLYVADAAFGCGLRQITASGVVTTLAGGSTCGYADGSGSAAKFGSYVGGIVYDPTDSDLYVDDSHNCSIRQVTLAGVVTTVAGAPPPTPACGAVDATGLAARFNATQGLAYDSANQSLYLSDRYRVRQVALPSYVVTTIAGPLPPNSQIGFVDGSGSAVLFNDMSGITYDSADGNLYVNDSGNAAIRQVTPAGIVTTIAGSNPLTPSFGGSSGGFGFSAQFGRPIGVAYDATTNALYVVDRGSVSIVQVQL